jgi:hypothetical protein
MTCWPLVAIAAMDLTVRGLTVLGPLVLERIVLWLVDPSQDTHVGYLWALAMLGIPLASAFLNAHAQGLGIHCYIRVRSQTARCVCSCLCYGRGASPTEFQVKSGLANLVYSKSLTFRKTSDATAAQPPQPPVSPPSPKKVNQQAQAKAVPALPPSDPHSTGNLMNLVCVCLVCGSSEFCGIVVGMACLCVYAAPLRIISSHRMRIRLATCVVVSCMVVALRCCAALCACCPCRCSWALPTASWCLLRLL